MQPEATALHADLLNQLGGFMVFDLIQLVDFSFKLEFICQQLFV